MGDRAVDCARLESVCAPKGHRGFESLPIRVLLSAPLSEMICKCDLLSD